MHLSPFFISHLPVSVDVHHPGSFKPVTDVVGGDPVELQPGQGTVIPSIALCLVESLIELRGFNPKDQMERYVREWKEGYLSSKGTPFDSGNMPKVILSNFLKTG